MCCMAESGASFQCPQVHEILNRVCIEDASRFLGGFFESNVVDIVADGIQSANCKDVASPIQGGS